MHLKHGVNIIYWHIKMIMIAPMASRYKIISAFLNMKYKKNLVLSTHNLCEESFVNTYCVEIM